jgi:hypothetical protein
MALRKTHSPSDASPTGSVVGYYVDVVSKTPYRSISDRLFCVWQYRIRATSDSLSSPAIDTSRAIGSVKIGLTFPSAIDIKQPELYPDCEVVQGVSVVRAQSDATQYVWVAPGGATSDHIDLFFLAPCEENPSTPVHLVFFARGSTWIEIPFTVPGQSTPAATQNIRGPAIAVAMPDSPPAPDPSPSPSPDSPTSPSPAPLPTPPAIPVTPLEAAARVVLKGTLVPLKVAAAPQGSHGLASFGMVRQLALSDGDTDSVRAHLESAGAASQREGTSRQVSASALDVFRSFEQPLVPALRPGIAAVAAIPVEELTTFSNALVQVRALQVRTAQQLATPDVGAMTQSLNAAVVAARGFAINTAAQPIGMLNLERIEMVPAGLQRGELIATIPLAPGEETAVVHKEWSVTSKEFTTIVTDSLEQTSETGVTDNTDLSQSTASQTQHSTQFNITGTVQGGIPMINGSSTAGVTAQDSESQSATDSIKHATTITQKASARSRQEHKTTISTTTVTGSVDTATRLMKNLSLTDPIRIDYFSLMRKWRVRLYRFGLRLTYDMVVPEPGAAMRRAYAELEQLRGRLTPFVFRVKYSDVTEFVVDKDGNPPDPGRPREWKPRYMWLADEFGVAVKPFPDSPPPLYVSVRSDGNRDWSYVDIQFNVAAGTRIRNILVSTIIGKNDGFPSFKILGARTEGAWLDKEELCCLLEADVFAPDGSPFMKGATGEQKLACWLDHSSGVSIALKVLLDNTTELIEQWRGEVWNALYNAAQSRYFGEQQKIAERIAAIEARISNVDTLTLRREESDEVMKSILKFVLGADFDFMPPTVAAAFFAESNPMDLIHGIAFDDQSLSGLKSSAAGVSPPTSLWSVLRQHEDIVRFINQAIEWENVVTFLYSYFWDLPQSWPFIRELRHPDPGRQAFLRAGSARIVLTVRKGWEAKWVRFTQDGTIDADLAAPTTDPYLTIAQEIAAYDDRNYPGIPPANPARAAVRLHDAVYTTSSVRIDVSTVAVTIAVASSTGFVVGLPVVLDAEDDRHIQESTLVTEIPDESHIMVAGVAYAHDGTQIPFAVLQPGDKGALVAEWYEYTPSSGTDIAVTSNLATIA